MPNVKITAMPSLGGNQVPTDLVTAVDLSAAPVNQNVKSTLNDLFATITKNITDRAIRFQAPGSAPAVSSANQGALYHNGTAFLASSNGGAYEPLYTLSAQSAALVFAGPTSGPAATPTFRALALTDLPSLATASLLGRVSAGTGTPEQITSTANLLTWLQNPTSNNLSAAVTDATGAGGAAVFAFGPTLTNPRFNTIAADPSGSGSNILFTPTVGAVNHIEVLNAVSGSGPTIRPTGLSANQPLNLSSRGTGIVSVTGNQLRVTGNTAAAAGILELRGGNSALSGGQIRFYEVTTNGTNYIGFQAPDSLISNLLFELPATDGTAGQCLTTDGAGILSWGSYNRAGVKNFLINGDMQIAQRGTTSTGIVNSGYYTADRWRTELLVAPGPNGQFTQSVVADYPDNSGFRQSLKMECSTTFSTPLGATAECRLEQRIEGLNCLPINFAQTGASELTLGFWVKSSNTGTYIAELIQPAGSVQVSAAYTITAANTWEKKSVTFPARTTGTVIANDNTYQLSAGFWLVAGSNYTGGSTLQTTWGNTTNRRAIGQTNLFTAGNYLQITGVQLEIGSVSTDFENCPFDIELYRCQRYYYLIASGAGKQISNTVAQTNSQAAAVFKFPTTMRASGAIIQVSGSNLYGIWNNGAVSTFNDFQSTAFTTDGVLLYRDGLSLTQGQAGYFYTALANALLAISAEI